MILEIFSQIEKQLIKQDDFQSILNLIKTSNYSGSDDLAQKSVSVVEETGMFWYLKRLASTFVKFDDSSESLGWHEIMEKC